MAEKLAILTKQEFTFVAKFYKKAQKTVSEVIKKNAKSLKILPHYQVKLQFLFFF